jgi:hypothetical protein
LEVAKLFILTYLKNTMHKIFLVLLCAFLSISMYACDACGCSIGGDSWGISPNNYRHFAGIRFQYRTFHNSHPASLSGDASEGMTSGDDYFMRAEVMGRFALLPRLQLFGALPYRYNERVEEGQTSIHNGIGDAALQLQWMVLKPGCNNWKHALQISAGGEAPTGDFRFSHEVPVAMQPGSGSWDWMAGLNYTLRFKNAGFNIEGMRRFNGYTKGGYDWGNSTSASSRIFATLYSDSSSVWMPWIGVNAEYYETNIENMKYQIRAAYTDGHLITSNAGIDFYSDKFGISLEAGLPVISNLAEGYSTMKFHLGARILFFIQNKTINKNQKSNEK